MTFIPILNENLFFTQLITMKLKLFAFAIISMLAFVACTAQTVTGTVVQVHDGDSFEIKFSADSSDFVRLAGCDAPEVYSPYVTLSQPYGKEATQAVREKLKGKKVLVEFLRYDRYGRPVCNIYNDDIGDLSYYMVSNGFAWWLDMSISDDKLAALKKAQNEAKDAGTGLWGLPGRKWRPSRWRQDHRGF